jgi:hypothetical protein
VRKPAARSSDRCLRSASSLLLGALVFRPGILRFLNIVAFDLGRRQDLAESSEAVREVLILCLLRLEVLAWSRPLLPRYSLRS